MGPDQEAEKAFIVHQVDPDSGDYDEDKVMLGFATEEDAKEAYLDHYDSPDFFGSMEVVDFEDFKKGKGSPVLTRIQIQGEGCQKQNPQRCQGR